MEAYDSYLNKLDTEIIELLSIRQELKINCKNFKVLELGGYQFEDTFTSKLDNEIFKYEIEYIDNIYKLFNENLKKDEIYEDLNLSRIIKQSYITLLYDFCLYGDDENTDYACKLDTNILLKLVERVHFGYNIIKFKYLENTDFYNKLIESNDSAYILYYLANYIYQPTYLDIIKDKCKEHGICDILVCTFYKNVIIPYYNEIQLHFCHHMKKLNKT
tara:strand:+ start:160 stop:810 length:651 start_codon:yes stop_codon:yes gene_type:complete